MSDERKNYSNDNKPEVVLVSSPDYCREENSHGNKKAAGGIGGVFDSVLDKIKKILSKFLGREAGNDDLLLLGMIVLLFLERKNKKENDDLDILLMVLIYLFMS